LSCQAYFSAFAITWGEGFLQSDCCSGIPPIPEDLGAACFVRTFALLHFWIWGEHPISSHSQKSKLASRYAAVQAEKLIEDQFEE
jgi:hypothetical protein